MNYLKWKLMSKYDKLIDAIKIAKNNHSRLHIMDAGIVLDFIRDEVTGLPTDSWAPTPLVERCLEEWASEAKAKYPVQFHISDDGVLRIYTSRPGYFIGKTGSLVDKYEAKIKSRFKDIKEIHFVEVNYVGEYQDICERMR